MTARGPILERRQIPVVPDILANGGGVVVSYFEWIQNRTGWQFGRSSRRDCAPRARRDASWDRTVGCTLGGTHILAFKQSPRPSRPASAWEAWACAEVAPLEVNGQRHA